MARKGWDNLTDNYRRRLRNKGITQKDYEAGRPLHKGRGKISARHESFLKRTRYFATTYDSGRHEESVMHHIRMMGAQQGDDYMGHVRKMVRAYESGDTTEARRLWEARDQSLPDYMHHYHGVFG